MNKPNLNEKPKEYFHTKQLIDEGKHEEALQLIDKFKENGEGTLHDILLYNLLKCDVLYQQGLWEELAKFAEQTYQESLDLGDNLLSVDALLKIAEALIWLGDSTRIDGIIKQVEELLKTQTQELVMEYKQREADTYTVKGFFHMWIKNDADKAIESFDHSIELQEEYNAKLEITKPLIMKAWTLADLKGEADRAFKLGEQALALSKENNNKYLIALSLHVRGLVYSLKGELDRGMKYYEESIAIFKELNNNFFIGLLFVLISWMYLDRGDLDKALEYAELILGFSEKTNNQTQIAYSLHMLAAIYESKGEIEKSIILYEKNIDLFKKIGNKFGVAGTLNNLSWCYRSIGDFKRALECIESSIKLHNEIGNLRAVANNYDFLIRILIDKGDLEQARNALEQFEHMKNQLNDKQTDLTYMFDKALVLKTSTRSRDRGKAEEILKNIIEDETIFYSITKDALLNLCELLLTELRITNDLEVLEEINSFTAQLLEIAEKSHSFSLFAEIYFLKAKLSLLTLDVKTARRFLTQAQKIAERFGLNQLATKISSEHKNLLDQLSTWENLKNTEISLTERIKLAGLNKHMKEVLQKSAIITAQISEQKVTIHREQKICLVCKGEIRGYMYVCDCDSIYCENCARALTDLENVCWVCDAPIDISKPTKPYKEEKLEEKDIIKDTPKKPKNHKL